MTFEESCKLRIPEKIGFDYLKINYLSNEDIKVCNYVADKLPSPEIKTIKKGRIISLEEFTEISLNEIKILGTDIYSQANSLITSVPIDRSYYDPLSFTTIVDYSVHDDDYVDQSSGKISEYIIPKRLYECSAIYFSHEHMHALKETNYDEYINVLTLGETIPIFLELIIFNPDNIYKIELLKARMHSLYLNKNEYLLATELFNNNHGTNTSFTDKEGFYHQRSLYECIQARVGCYLNSFYYALILYNMYKENSNKILTLVSKVLNHEMTTLEMLKELEIYADIKGEIFEKELGIVKKLIK